MDQMYNSNIELQSSMVLKQSTALYVEGDSKLFATTKSMFDYVFDKAYSTTDAKEALSIFQNSQDKIDIIIIDMHIEDFCGVEFVQKVREINENVIIVISILPFSDNSSEDYMKRSDNFSELIKLRINDLLQKPYQPMTTLKVISKHLVAKENAKLVESQKASLFNLKYVIDHQNLLSETDPHGIIIYANDIFCKVSGYSKDELLGQSHSIIRHPDMEAKVFKEMWKTIQSGKIWEGKVKNRKKDGGYYWVNSIIIPIIEDGKITKYMASRQDITELVDKEKQMKQEIKRIKSENYRDRELISKQAYDDGIARYTKEFENLKLKINLLQDQLKKAEAKRVGSMSQIDQLIKSEKAANDSKEKVLAKAKVDISKLFDKNKELERDKARLEKKLQDTEIKLQSMQKSIGA